jgi:pyrroline-5-carboxylate reductase
MAGQSLVLIGCGKMGTALLRGWLAGKAAARFDVVEPEGPPPGLPEADGVAFHGHPDALPRDLDPAAVVFAVKPQIADAVVPDYRRFAGPGACFMSIIAGKPIAGLARHLGEAAIVRTMPNMPAAIGRGITVACANAKVSAGQRQLCERLLAAIGESAWVEDEALLDPVTAVSGSGPAYVFLLIEALAEAGAAMGLPADLALRLAEATVAGSGELARIAAESPGQLRESVTSPGGTTRAALDVLMAADGLVPLFRRAVAAATARSRELAG